MPTKSTNATRGTSTPSSRKFPNDARTGSRIEKLLSICRPESRPEPRVRSTSRLTVASFRAAGQPSCSVAMVERTPPPIPVGNGPSGCHCFDSRSRCHRRADWLPAGSTRLSSYLKYFSTSASNCAVSRVNCAKLSTLSLLTTRKPVSVKAGIVSPLARTYP